MKRGSVRDLWRTTGYLVEPQTDRELMSIIGAIGTHSTGQRFAWRGMSSADYRLSSSLHRLLGESSDETAVRSAEDELIERAHSWGLGVTRLGMVDDLQLLADLQHYGVPTRLIDVTSDPMTALWFACQRPTADVAILDGLVVALNITGLQPRIALTPSTMTYDGLGATPGFSRTSALASQNAFTVRAAEANPRLASQAGYFIAGAVPQGAAEVFPSVDIPFRPRSTPLDLLSPRSPGQPEKLPFVAILVMRAVKEKLLAHLDGTYNKSARTLFPDFSGFREFGTLSGSGEPSKAV